jgi:hypothetical protein
MHIGEPHIFRLRRQRPVKRAAMRLLWALSMVLLSTAAGAAETEFSLRRLGNPRPDAPNFEPAAEGNFRSFARQLAATFSSAGLTPAQSIGSLGFAVAIESGLVSVPQESSPWPTTAPVPSVLFVPSVSVRKGLPYSFELGARAAWLSANRLGAASVGLRWAVSEGINALPDIVIGASLTTLINAPQMQVATAGTSLTVGRRFVVRETVGLSPYLGWNLAFVSAVSDLIDFSPNPSLSDSDLARPGDAGNARFAPLSPIENSHNRFYAGCEVGYGIFRLTTEISFAVLGRFRDGPTNTARDIPGVFAFNTAIGVSF